jgi:hypothetical protein
VVKCSEVLQCSGVLLCIWLYMVFMFCMLLFISVGYIFLLLCLCILIVMHVLFSTLTEVFPCFFLSCKANARVYLAKTGHGPHSSYFMNCVVLCIVCVNCVVLCIVCV